MSKILLADDEAATRTAVAAALRALGHDVATADDGAEALALLTAPGAGFSLLVSDVQMPELDGMALAAAALARLPGLKVILMSGHADGFAGIDALRPRLAGVLTKPVAPDVLRAAVSKALG